MAAMISRLFTALIAPPVVEKNKDAIRFGILGAAKVAPTALINIAKSHPEVIIVSIAARDRIRADAFARKHSIPDVKSTYQEILDDPSIDAVFVPLANSFHFEWAVRSIRAGKHVLLEKPSVNSAAEAEILFNLPELSRGPNPPVLMEAFHNLFHPSIHKFLSFVTPAEVEHVHTDSMIPSFLAPKDGICFDYDLGGGTMIMIGTYNFAVLRMIFGTEPQECLSAETTVFGDGVHDRCDTSFKTEFRFPNGGIGYAESTFRGSIFWKPSEARVTHRQVVVPDDSLPVGQEKLRTRTVTLHGFVHAIIWHRIDVKDAYVIRNKEDGRPIKTWTESSSHKAYSYKEAGGEFADGPGETWWMSYHHQLEQFVNRVKGRETRYFITGEDSVNQARMIDMAYVKSGLGLRPTSEFR
ncbi:putative oxidoreductase [Coniochaeta sp. 2T2.1]|nr:putative oxidoreductase [Coniochaeta sp. 2T2.1]